MNASHASEHAAQAPLATSSEGWRSLLGNALSELRLKLASFPVLSASGVAIHQESAIRLQTEAEGPWLPAGDFMPMAERLKLTAELDLQVIQFALSGLKTGRGDIAVYLSADSIADWGFHNKLVELLGQHAGLCKRLWVEVAEQGVFRQPEAFRDLCRTLKGLGCRVGIEQVEQTRASVKLTETQLGYTVLHSPISGVVLVKSGEIGEVVNRGTPILTLADIDHVWLNAYVEEADLGRVTGRQEVLVTTDLNPPKEYKGKIYFISSQAEVTPKSIQTEKERVTLVYRIKINLSNPDRELKPGMPADGRIILGKAKEFEGSKGQAKKP